MNRIVNLFTEKKKDILSIYFTAGFPRLNDTRSILAALQEAGTDLVEIGMPYSDPVADGETIQASNQRALDNGMTVARLFQQLQNFRNEGVTLPVILMGYFNPVYQYGVEAFCRKCQELGIDGVILPDLPLDEYLAGYSGIFEQYGLLNIFLITPQTSDERIRQIDNASSGFIYMVSSASVTGATSGVNANMEAYFERVNNLGLKNPRLVGFGIKDRESFERSAKHASGAIIGSQFVRVLEAAENDLEKGIREFVGQVRPAGH
ncbi:tryptophan synthase subunit alpha [Leadbetterella sp. DM7]|uniref:tryptophan synthase subunit alpha n=1 Tax=Leadbetterella sp. DM7 TaxID=3235085 RepID=UPI00349EECF4